MNPEELSKNQWLAFKQSIEWRAILFELAEREKYILDLLRGGNDPKWADENMRGRLHEIEYFTVIPDIIIKDLELLEDNQKIGKGDSDE